MIKTDLHWEQHSLLGSWTAHLSDDARYLVQADHQMDWVLHKVIQYRYHAMLIRKGKPALNIGHYPTTGQARQACLEHWQAQ